MRKFEYVKNASEYMNEYGNFKLPERSTANSAGYDFFSPVNIVIPPFGTNTKPTLVPTGVKAQMEKDEFLMLVNRSSNPGKKFLVIPNSMGIIDADYYNNQDNEGEMFFAFYNLSNENIVIYAGDKLGQGIFVKYGITDDDAAEGERVGGFRKY